METQVQFPKFIQDLKDAGLQVSGAAFLQDPNGAWRSLDAEARTSYLLGLGMNAAPDAVEVRIRKKSASKGKKSLDNVLVIFSVSDAAAAAPAAAAPAAPPEEEVIAAPAPETPAPTMGAATVAEDEPFLALEPVDADADEDPASPGSALVEAAQEPATTPASALIEADSDEPASPPHSALVEAAAEPAQLADAALFPDADIPHAPAQADAAPEPAPAAEKKRTIFGRFRKKDAEAEAEAEAVTGGVTEIPPTPGEQYETVEVYAVQEPYAYVRILHDKDKHEHRYEVIEPLLSEREQNILDFIENTLVDVIEIGLSALTREQAAELLRKHVDEVVYDYSIVLNAISREKLLYYILRDFLGFGKLDPIMRDEFIEDVSCDGPGVPIFLYHRKYESVKSMTVFETDQELDSFVIKMAQRSGKHVSIAEPLLDATLPDGSRLNATLSDEVTDGGSTYTIRKFREDPFTIPDLVRFGTMNEDLLAYWWLAVQNGASAIYAGGTASGKTTSLNAILLFIPPSMKIVSIEDTREVNIPHENWIAGVTRSGFGPRDNNGRQAGEIDMFTLLKAALRQRPEYILVGEVRGAEATALFQAMATGHTAYGTMHADSTEAVIHRLESDPISIPRSLLEALDIVSIQIQTRIGDRRVRRTKELVEIVGLDPHTREILTNEVFSWSPVDDKFEFSGVSYVLERIQIERNMSESDMRDEFDQRKRIIRWMVDNDVRSLADVGRIIATYYRDPEKILQLIGQGADAETVRATIGGSDGPSHKEQAAQSEAESEHAAEAEAPPQRPRAGGGAGAAPPGPKPLSLTIVEGDDEMGLTEVPEEAEEANGAQ